MDVVVTQLTAVEIVSYFIGQRINEMSMKDINKQPTLLEKAKDRKRTARKKSGQKRTEGIVKAGLILSAALTIIYLTIAIYNALVGWGWHPILAGGVALFVGVIAIVPGEMAVNLWMDRLQTDRDITGGQIAVAWFGGISAVLASAVATISFFAFILDNFSPGWYDNETAASVNLISVGASWMIFLTCIFLYKALSIASKQNKRLAEARNDMKEADADMLEALAQAKREATDRMLAQLEDAGVFLDNAFTHLGQEIEITDERRQTIERGMKPTEDPLLNGAAPKNKNEALGFGRPTVPTDEQIADFLERHPQYRS